MSEISPDYSQRGFDDTVLKNTKFWEGWWTARKIRKEAAVKNSDLVTVIQKHLTPITSNPEKASREKALTLKALRWLSDNEIKELSHLGTSYLEIAQSLAKNKQTILAFDVALFSKDAMDIPQTPHPRMPLSKEASDEMSTWQIPVSLNEELTALNEKPVSLNEKLETLTDKLKVLMKRDRSAFLAKMPEKELILFFDYLIEQPAIMGIKNYSLKEECIRLCKQLDNKQSKKSSLSLAQLQTLQYSVFLLLSIHDRIAAGNKVKNACTELNLQEKPRYATLKAVIDRFETLPKAEKRLFLGWLSPRSILFLLPYISQPNERMDVLRDFLGFVDGIEARERAPLIAFLDKCLSQKDLPSHIQRTYRILWDELVRREEPRNVERIPLKFSDDATRAVEHWQLPAELTDYNKIIVDQYKRFSPDERERVLQRVAVPYVYLLLLPALLKETPQNVTNKQGAVTKDKIVKSIIDNLRSKNEKGQREAILDYANTNNEKTLQDLTNTLLDEVQTREVSIEDRGDKIIALRNRLMTFPAIDAENLKHIANALQTMNLTKEQIKNVFNGPPGGALLFLIPLLVDQKIQQMAIDSFFNRLDTAAEPGKEREQYLAFLYRYLSDPKIPDYIRVSYLKIWNEISKRDNKSE